MAKKEENCFYIKGKKPKMLITICNGISLKFHFSDNFSEIQCYNFKEISLKFQWNLDVTEFSLEFH